MRTTCPGCGSQNTFHETISENLTGKAGFKTITLHCRTCGGKHPKETES